MGSRSRKRGLTNAAVRALKAAGANHEAHAAKIGADIYNIACTERDPADELPLEVRAPLSYLGLRAAPHVLGRLGMELSHENVAAVQEYLTQGWVSMFVELDADHFKGWVAQAGRVSVGGPCEHCGKPAGDHALRDGLRWCDDGTLSRYEAMPLDTDPPAEEPGDWLRRRAFEAGKAHAAAGKPPVLTLDELPTELRGGGAGAPGVADAWAAGYTSQSGEPTVAPATRPDPGKRGS